MAIPEGAEGLVIFAHGSGSSRFSSRNRFVAEQLNERGLATLLVDLLTPEEEKIDIVTREMRFDIPLLAGRLEHIIDWAGNFKKTREFAIGLFGSSTGAAAALIAAAHRGDRVRAVVSRGGRADLAGELLPFVNAPALLIVGERDQDVLRLNRLALARLNRDSRLDVVPRATHLFEEPGALAEAAQLAGAWFKQYLGQENVSQIRQS